MKKFKPAKLTLENGKTINIVAECDWNGEVDIKVVDDDGDAVEGGILVTIRPDGIYRIEDVSASIGIPINKNTQVKLSKGN